MKQSQWRPSWPSYCSHTLYAFSPYHLYGQAPALHQPACRELVQVNIQKTPPQGVQQQSLPFDRGELVVLNFFFFSSTRWHVIREGSFLHTYVPFQIVEHWKFLLMKKMEWVNECEREIIMIFVFLRIPWD